MLITGEYRIWAADSQVSVLLHGRQPLSSVLHLVCWQAPLKLMGRCHKDRSGHLPSLSSSFHWVYPWKHKQDAHVLKKTKHHYANQSYPFDVPVFCTLRQRHTPSIHFQERLVRIQRQRFATQNVRQTSPWLLNNHFRDSVNNDNSPGHWKQERQISSILQKWTSWVCPLFVCVQIVGDAHPAHKPNRSRSGTWRLLANAMLIWLFRF